MAYLLLILVLAGLIYAGWRLTRMPRPAAEDARDRPGRRSGFPASARPRGQHPAPVATRRA